MKIEIDIPDEVIQDMKIGQPFSDELMKETLLLMTFLKLREEYGVKSPLFDKWILEQNIDERALKQFRNIMTKVDFDKIVTKDGFNKKEQINAKN